MAIETLQELRKQIRKLWTAVTKREPLLKKPCTCIITASTQYGKSTFIGNIMREESSMFSHPVPTHYYYFSPNVNHFLAMVNKEPVSLSSRVTCVPCTAVPTIKEVKGMYGNLKGSVLIFDDLTTTNFSTSNREALSSWACMGAHHEDVTVIIIAQRFYDDGKLKNASSNSQVLLFGLDTPSLEQAKNYFRRNLNRGETRPILDGVRLKTPIVPAYFNKRTRQQVADGRRSYIVVKQYPLEPTTVSFNPFFPELLHVYK